MMADTLEALRALIPYAESRAEDMTDCAQRTDERAEWELAEKAWSAVNAAKAIIAEHDGTLTAGWIIAWQSYGVAFYTTAGHAAGGEPTRDRDAAYLFASKARAAEWLTDNRQYFTRDSRVHVEKHDRL